MTNSTMGEDGEKIGAEMKGDVLTVTGRMDQAHTSFISLIWKKKLRISIIDFFSGKISYLFSDT